MSIKFLVSIAVSLGSHQCEGHYIYNQPYYGSYYSHGYQQPPQYQHYSDYSSRDQACYPNCHQVISGHHNYYYNTQHCYPYCQPVHSVHQSPKGEYHVPASAIENNVYVSRELRGSSGSSKRKSSSRSMSGTRSVPQIADASGIVEPGPRVQTRNMQATSATSEGPVPIPRDPQVQENSNAVVEA